MVTENLQVNKVSVSCLQVRNGIYQAVLEYYDENGKRHLPWRSTGLKERGNKKQALVVAEQLREKLEKELQIKTTNEIVYNGKKLGGILTQTKVVKENVKCLIVGIGINTEKQNFVKEIKDIATSIKKEFGIYVDTKQFIAEFCNQFEKEILEIRYCIE